MTNSDSRSGLTARATQGGLHGSAADRLDLISLLQQAPGFICFLRGPTLIFELANSAYLQLVGHRDILGKPVRVALPEVEGQGYFEVLDRVYATSEPFVGRNMKVDLQRIPGAALSEAYVDFIYQPILGDRGEVVGILAQGHDVTEARRQESQREAAEAALRASEERYRCLFESIDDGFCLLQMICNEQGDTIDYRFLEANSAFEAHTGLKSPLGKTARELVPDLDASWFELYGKVAETGKAVRFENHAAAMGRWFEVYASRAGSAALGQVALVFKDITERKDHEQQRERLLAREMEARRHAEEASRFKDEFLATLSHELRTPLNAILGWIHLLRAGSLSEDKRVRALETVERNARSQAQLIDDLLDVSRIMAGKLRLDVEPVDLRPVIESALDTVRPAAEAKGLHLQATLSTGCIVMGDGNRLQQVVWNLLSNAVKFMSKGAGRIQVLLECRDSSAEITVADRGRGIAKEFLPYVFERFRQQEGGTARAHGGLGLGLSIVRQLVEMHGGTATAFSEGEGRGATFTVRIPLAPIKRRETSSPASATTTLRCPPEVRGLHVLVLDDEQDAREMVSAVLEECGCQVRQAATAEECRGLLSAALPDIIISDIGMPDEDGYGFIEKLRKLPAHAGGSLPVVALTAYARTEDRTRALLAGFSSHVPKPVEPMELLAVVASLAGRVRRDSAR